MKKKKLVWIIGSITLLTVGTYAIPKLLKKATAQVYKNTQPEIDFDKLEPDIVRKEDTEQEYAGQEGQNNGN